MTPALHDSIHDGRLVGGRAGVARRRRTALGARGRPYLAAPGAPNERPRVLSALALLVAGVWVALQWGQPVVAFNGAFSTGGFTLVFEEIALVAAFMTLLIATHLGRDDQSAGGQSLLLWATAGAMIMAGAGNLLTIFLGLELLSLALYCLCGLAPRGTAREAALKYLILSSTASGFMLYGMALLFGSTGSVSLVPLATGTGPLFAVGAGLFLVGIAFKLSLVPFHMWTPDVYEGAPLAVTAFMSVVTKAGVLAALARFAYVSVANRPADRRCWSRSGSSPRFR